MNTILQTIASIGITSNLSLTEKRSIRFTNFGILIAVLFCAISFCINIVSINWKASLFPLSYFFLFSGVFYLQYQRRFQSAKITGLTLAILSVILSCWFFSLSSFLFFKLLLTFGVGLVFFPKKRHQTILFIIHLISLGIIILGASYINNYVMLPNPLLFGVMTFIFSMTLLFFIIRTFTLENQRFEHKTNQLLNSLLSKQKELELEKIKVEKQARALTKANEELQQEIQERKLFEKKLRTSNEELEQFAYIASHDLKEPLRTIGSFSKLLKKDLKGTLDKNANEYLNFILVGVQQMNNLMDDLLQYSRVGRNIKNEKEVVDLNLTLDLVQYNLQSALKKSKGQIVKQHVLPKLKVNRTQITQLFQNLISNGLKFRNGATPLVEIDVKEAENHYVFSVKDNGIGIAPKYNNKIFTIFHRLHNKTEFEGTGIGLAICKKVVQNHGGKIWVNSTLGQGATFYFSIQKVKG